jgi:EmrB/QacA subfamily drug resistance transporter
MEAQPQRKWATVIVACIAIFIIVLDSSSMNVAIPTVVVELNTDLSTMQALIAIYSLIIASFLLAGSKLQDVLGRKRTFLIGAVIYGIGTATAALCINTLMLLIGWSVIEGIGAALMLPATTTLISATYKGKDRLRAFGIWGGIAAMGAAIGPLYGGVLTSFLTWRLIFGFEVLGVIAIFAGQSYLRESVPHLKWRDFDVIGAVLSIIALVLIVLGLLLLRSPQDWSLVSLFVGLGIIIFGAFLFWERRRTRQGAEPLVNIAILRNRTYNLGNVASAIQNIALAGVLILIPVFLQQVTKVSAFMTGAALLPMSIAVFVLSLSGNWLTVRLRPKSVVLLGFLVSAAGAFILRDVFTQSTQIVNIIPGTVIFGIGVGMLLSQLTNLTISAVTPQQETDASGFFNTAKNLGYSIGTALVGALVIIGLFNGLVLGIGTSTLVNNTTTTEQVRDSLITYAEKMQTTAPPNIPPDLIQEAQRITNTALASATHLVFLTLSVIMLLGFVVTLFIRDHRTS